jgi:hypothetical protein
MEKIFWETNKEEIEKTMDLNYGFDPSAIITIVSQHPKIGLALVQLPINIANALIHKYNDLKWSDNPTKPGYYWVKSHDGAISIKEYSSKDIDTIISTGLNGITKSLFKFSGPLEPPL